MNLLTTIFDGTASSIPAQGYALSADGLKAYTLGRFHGFQCISYHKLQKPKKLGQGLSKAEQSYRNLKILRCFN